MSENNHESFVRWQQKYIDELGKIITLFIGMSFANIAFVINQLTGKDFKFANYIDEIGITIGCIVLLLCVILFILLSLNRYKGFKRTAEVAKYREETGGTQNAQMDTLRRESKNTDKITLRLFSFSTLLFGIGELLVVGGFIAHVWTTFGSVK